MWDEQESSEGGFGEWASCLAHPQLAGDPLHALAFDPLEEALWAGTGGGVLSQLAVSASPSTYASVTCHTDHVIDLRALGEAVASLSSCELAVHASGCAPRVAWEDEVRLCTCCSVAHAAAHCSRWAAGQEGSVLVEPRLTIAASRRPCRRRAERWLNRPNSPVLPCRPTQVGDLTALEVEPRSTRVVLGRAGGGLVLLDMQKGKPVGTVS